MFGPTEAITMTHLFEMSTTNREDAIYTKRVLLVEPDGTPNGSSNHPLIDQSRPSPLREGAPDPFMPGPLGATLIQRLTDPTTGIVLDSWLDADADLQGDALLHVGTP